MQIREVSPEELDFVSAVCLDPSIPPSWREAMEPFMAVRKEWLKTMMRSDLQVSVALEKPEAVIDSLGSRASKFRAMVVKGEFPKGLIEYVPIEFAPEPVRGKNSVFINCMWVVPPFWRRGVATALLERVVRKAGSWGGASVLAYEGDKWFGFFPYMPVGFFKKFGFEEADRNGSRVLLHLSLGDDEKPTLIRPKTKVSRKNGKMAVDVLFNSQCPWSGWMVDKIKRNIKKYYAEVHAINTDNRTVLEEYGVSRGVFVDGKPVIRRMASWKEVEAIVARRAGSNPPL